MSRKWIPYGRQWVDQDDIDAVVEVLKSDWLTTGPQVEAFERELAERVGAQYAVVLNSGTAALHAAYFAAGLGPGDTLLTTPLTFAATANAALYLGANVLFCDVDPETGNLDPKEVEKRIHDGVKVVAPVDYAGHPADLDEIIEISHAHGAVVVEDACHALGATYKGRPVGSISDMTVFSFHPVKHITTGEGGAVVTNNPEYAERVRRFRNHGIVRDGLDLSAPDRGPWYYEMRDLGLNYRLPDINCALGRSQLRKLDRFLERRREIAAMYVAGLADVKGLRLPIERDDAQHAWHLYVVRAVNAGARRAMVEFLHGQGIGVQVHYIPVYRHPFYQGNCDRWSGSCPRSEQFYNACVSLPISPSMKGWEVDCVVSAMASIEALIR